MITTFTRRLLAASMLALAACSGKKSPTGTTQPTARISVTAGSATLSVAQNAAGSSAITIARTNYSGDVTLTAEGLPSGVTAAFTPATLASGVTASSLALTVTGSAAAGTSTITVRARGNGVTDATTSLALTVTASATGTVGLALTPAAATITAGQTITSTLAITRAGGFTGGVNLTLTGAPTGLQFAFSSANPVTSDAVTVTFTAATSLVPGPYTLTLRANAAGLTEATSSYVLTVNPPPSNNVSWRYCNTDRIPLWFAYLDGTSGTWQRVTPTTAGQYDFAVGQPTVGITAVYADRSVTVTEVRYLALSEVAAAAAAECAENPAIGTKAVTGSITGFGSANESANVAIGTAVSNSANQSAPTFSLSRVQSGPRDLIAARINVGVNALRLLLIRGTNFADGGTTGPLDLGAGSSFAPASATVTITAPNDGTLLGSSNFTTATNTGLTLPIGSLSSTVPATYQGVPDAQLLSTDLQRVTVTQNVGNTIARAISRYIRGPANIDITMPADPAAPTLTTASGGPYTRASAAGSVASAFNRQVTIVYDHRNAPVRWIVSSTSASRAGGLSYTVTMPDFSQIPGWTAAWQLPAGIADVTSTFLGQSGAGANGEPISGSTFYTIGRKSQFTF